MKCPSNQSVLEDECDRLYALVAEQQRKLDEYHVKTGELYKRIQELEMELWNL